MSITYRTISGDTFESISRKKYGTEENASLISKSNPGLIEPISGGIDIIIPDDPNAPQDIIQQSPSDNINETALLINGERFRFWESILITRSIDSIDTINVSAPFDSSEKELRDAFRPFTFKKCVVTIGNDTIFTGTVLPAPPILTKDKSVISVNAYSLPGVLNDCPAPASSYPLEFNDQGLNDIATSMCSSFGLGVEFRDNQGAIFERVDCSPGKKVLAFLIELAKQRNLILTNTEDGKLLFWKSIEFGEPVAVLEQGSQPVMSVTPFFVEQEYYSSVTGIEPVFLGLKGSQYTVKNPKLTDVVRPFTFTVPDTQTADIKEAVDAKASRMFGNIASYHVKVNTLRDPKGNLWEPNTIIKLTSPETMVYNPYDFLIKSVEMQIERSSDTSVIELVIPESFNGKIPEVLPWEE